MGRPKTDPPPSHGAHNIGGGFNKPWWTANVGAEFRVILKDGSEVTGKVGSCVGQNVPIGTEMVYMRHVVEVSAA